MSERQRLALAARVAEAIAVLPTPLLMLLAQTVQVVELLAQQEADTPGLIAGSQVYFQRKGEGRMLFAAVSLSSDESEALRLYLESRNPEGGGLREFGQVTLGQRAAEVG